MPYNGLAMSSCVPQGAIAYRFCCVQFFLVVQVIDKFCFELLQPENLELWCLQRILQEILPVFLEL